MVPLYDPRAELVAWLEPGRHIFALNMNWVAFLRDGHAWSSNTGNWLGPINGFNCLDRQGRVVAWSPGAQVQGSAAPEPPVSAVRPAKPLHPLHPVSAVRPLRPIAPAEGWSRLAWAAWLAQ